MLNIIRRFIPQPESVMGKYFAWLLFPGGILLLIFLFTHVF
jgi:hypothetical protein